MAWSRLLLVACVLLVSPQTSADDFCQEPDDDAFYQLMDAARQAIEAEDFDAALANLELARRSHQPAVLDFSIARAYHNLERWDEAVDSYNTFLRHFEGCDDPNGLVNLAQNYRTLALQSEAMNQAEIVPDGRINPGVWVLASGGALLLGGVVFDLANSGLDEDLERAYREDDEIGLELESDRDTAEIVDIVLYGTGTAAVITGVVLLLVLDDEPVITPAVEQSRSGGVVWSLGGHF